MKKTLYTILLPLIICTITTSVFSQITNDSIGCVPLLSKFTSPVADLKKPYWDFADGASSDKINPSHVYSAPGEYIVKLYDDNILKAQKKIVVFADVNVIIDQDLNQGCAPMTINFKNISTKDTAIKYTEFLWDFGDGLSANTENPFHTYTDIGKYNVTLNISTNIAQCNATKIFENAINIEQKLNINFKLDSIVPACSLPAKVYYSFTGPVDTSFIYKWDFGNGMSSDLANPGPITYSSANVFNISLTIDNKKGCISKILKSVNINRFDGDLKIKIGDTICINQFFEIVNNSTHTNYSWDFGPNALPKTSTSKNPQGVIFTQEGTESIKLKVSNSQGCSKDTTIEIFVIKPYQPFTCEPMAVCKLPAEITYTAVNSNLDEYIWNGVKGGSTFTVTRPFVERDTFYYNPLDSFKMELATTAQNGCKSKFVKKMPIQLPNAQFTLDKFEGIVPFTLVVRDVSESLCPITKWIYTWGDGTSTTYDANTIGSASHTYTIPGKYYVNLSIENEKGCTDLHYGAWIKVGEPRKIIDPPICNSNGNLPIFCYLDTVRIITTITPDENTAIHFNLGNTVSHCESQTSIVHVLNDKPGIEPLFLSIENAGTFEDIYSLFPVTILGAKAVLNYEVSCTEKYKVTFKDNSINATSSYWKLDDELIYEKDFERKFLGPGKHKITLCAYNDKDNCDEHCTESIFELQDPKAVINTKDLWCKGIKNTLYSKNSQDAFIGCKMGYTWEFSKNADYRTIITDVDSINVALNPGIHTVSLEIRDVNGCRDTAYKSIKVYDLEADFLSSFTEFCNPINVLFRDKSIHDTIITNYKWSFAPTVSQDTIWQRFDNIKDSISIGLTVKDKLGCESSVIKNFKIYKPITEVTYKSTICDANAINFTASDFTEKGSKLIYDWRYNTNQVSTKNTLQLTNLTVGDHTVNLNIKEEKTGCTNVYSYPFKVIEKPQAIISALEDSIFCYPKSIQLYGNKSTFNPIDQLAYQWTFGNTRRSTKINPIETFTKGEFNVMLVVKSAYQCNDTTIKKIKLVGPEGRLNADKQKVCIGEFLTLTLSGQKDVTSYYWDFGQGETKNNVSPVSQKYDFYPSSGKTFVVLVLESAEKGCETLLTIPIELYKSEAKFEADSTCEKSLAIKNNSLGNNDYTWKVNDNIASADSNFVFTPNDIGTYTIYLSIKNKDHGCLDTFSKTIAFLQKPTINVSNTDLCDDQTYSFLKDQNAINYEIIPNGVFKEIGNKYLATIQASQNFYIKVKSKNGCIKDENLSLTYVEADNIDTAFYLPICGEISNIKIPIQLEPSDSIFWSFTNGDYRDILDCIKCPSPNLSQNVEGILTAKVIDYKLCKSINYTFEIDKPKIEVPNYFSPNDDAANEEFKPVIKKEKARAYFNIIQLSIHNRWGKEVYNSNLPWDGNINGQPAAEEVYYYTMTYGTATGCIESVKGNLTLAR